MKGSQDNSGTSENSREPFRSHAITIFIQSAEGLTRTQKKLFFQCLTGNPFCLTTLNWKTALFQL